MKRGLGEIERLLFAYVQMRGQPTVRAGELVRPLRLSGPRERNLLSRLAKAGWIVRVQRGLYLVPRKLPLGGKWTPNEVSALNTLMEERKGRYQICGPNAFNLYGFDDQVPVRVYAYNNRISGERKIGAVDMTLIKVADVRLGSTEETTTAEGEKGIYSSRIRTLVDAVEWVRADLKKKRITAQELVDATLRYGDVGTIRRIGYLLERESVDPALLRKLERALKPTRSFIPWIPSKPKRGSINRSWGVVDNERT